MSIALLGNAADVLPELVKRGFTPDLVTDQTSAHDPLHGYLPAGMSLEKGESLRSEQAAAYISLAKKSMAHHVGAMLELQKAGGGCI
ncbi:hypothetical protein GCM10020331_049820 [Ectobacillus funiculus]